MKKILAFAGKRKPEPGFDSLVRPHLEYLYRLAYRFCGRPEDAEDLVQDLLVKLYPRYAELVKVEKLRPWLVTSLYRMFVDGVRRQARSPLELINDETAFYDTVAGTVNEPDETLLRHQRLDLIQAAFARLSEEHRSLLTLHDMEGYRLVELEEMLEVPIGTLKSRIHRARARMRDILDEGTL